MRFARWIVLSVAVVGVAAHAAPAIEFKSVGTAPAVLYDAPSLKGRKLYVAPRGMPVEVVLTYGEWNKVRDATGDLAWVQAKLLAAKRNLAVKVHSARVHSAAEDAAPVVFTADKGVLLELLESANGGWVKVRHRDGQTGYVKSAEVWGE